MSAAGSITGLPLIARRVRVMASVFYALMVEYRAEIMLWALATALPLIMMGVWAQAGAEDVLPLTQGEVVRYFLAVFIVRQLTVVWVVHEFEWQVTTGRLSPLLLQPADPAWRYIMIHVGEQLARLPVVGLLLVGCLLLYPSAVTAEDGGWWLPEWWRVALAIVAAYIGWFLRFWMQYALCMGAFWYERISAAHNLIYLPYVFLSGMVMPLSVLRESMGQTVYDLVMLTPFPWMIWFPAALVMGKDVDLLRGFTMLIGWTVVMWLVQRWCWRVGIRHYSAMGA